MGTPSGATRIECLSSLNSVLSFHLYRVNILCTAKAAAWRMPRIPPGRARALSMDAGSASTTVFRSLLLRVHILHHAVCRGCSFSCRRIVIRSVVRGEMLWPSQIASLVRRTVTQGEVQSKIHSCAYAKASGGEQ